ncbi:MAG: DUF2817 domain-containing protein [Pseudomonadota bacterium]
MSIEQYQCFPETYAEGREWFAQTVQQCDGLYESRVNPDVVGAVGETLSTDVGWFGPREASRVFVSICGTHGQEYFSGAATQLNWMLSGGPAKLADDVAVCLIHCNNPYGASFLSRGNENFVDLNRNYLDFSQPIRPNPLYDDLFKLLFTPEMSEHVLDDVMQGYVRFMEETDPQAAMTTVGGGQNTHPSGIIYCGDELQWSTRNMQAIVDTYLDQAKTVALIDWHTGLGEFGETSCLFNNLRKDSDEFRWACAWWGRAEDASGVYDAGVYPDFVGNVDAGISEQLQRRGVKVAATVIEFGTVDNRTVIPALLIDRWLRFECQDPQSPHAVRMRTMMMERLNPSQYNWREAVRNKSLAIYQNTLAGLSLW